MATLEEAVKGSDPSPAGEENSQQKGEETETRLLCLQAPLRVQFIECILLLAEHGESHGLPREGKVSQASGEGGPGCC